MMYRQKGFTLIELAIGLVIIGLILGGALMSLTAQRENEGRRDTDEQLRVIKEAITGFALANGYIPCPATATTNRVQSPATGGNCTTQHGFVPSMTLGISGRRDNNGRLLDSWNKPLRYSVTQTDNGGVAGADFTTSGDMRSVQMQNLSPDLNVCQSANCPPNTVITSSAPVVVYSMGKNWALTAGTDEIENSDASDLQFVSRAYAALNGPGQFDDLVEWLSPQVLYNRMVTAGQLP